MARLTLLVGFCAVSGILSASIAIVIWQHRPRAGAAWLAVTLCGLTLWSVGEATILAAESTGVIRGAGMLSFLGMGMTAHAWMLFCLRYSGRDGWWWPWLRVLVWVPLAGVLTLVSPDVFSVGSTVDTGGSGTIQWGPVALAFFVYGYLTNLVGNGTLLVKFRHSRNIYRRRTAFFVLGGVIVVVGHAASVLDVSPLPNHTLVPMLFLGIGLGSVGILADNRILKILSLKRLSAPITDRFDELEPLARDAVIEEMGGGVVVLDANNRIVDLNPAARQLLDAESERVVGVDIESALDTERFEAEELPFLDPTVTDQTFSEMWVTVEDGSRHCYDIILTGLESGGETVGRVGLVHDVTALQRQKERVEAQKRELERKNEQLDEFAGIVSHDLRNPLNVARGRVQVTRETGDVSHLETAEDSLERMEGIIDDVLTLARQGQSIGETEAVALKTVTEEAWTTVATESATLDTDSTAGVSVNADPDRLRQLLENLFRNAVDHGSETVTVHVATLDDGGFYVADDGPGIPESERDRVLQQGYTTSSDGTGFGLAIVSAIAEAHGWLIEVTDSESGGARFEFRNVTLSSR